MTGHDDDLLAAVVLGTASEAERARVEADAARDPALRARLDAVRTALDALPDALPAVTPSSDGRRRLLAAAAPRPRLARFADRLARFLDVGLERARAILESVDDASSYEESGLPGVRFFHLEGGPAVAGAHIGIVRIQAGGRFPYHGHGGGTERVLFLQGACHEPETGRSLRAGDEDEVRDGSFAHELVVLPGPDLLYAAALFGELTFPERA